MVGPKTSQRQVAASAGKRAVPPAGLGQVVTCRIAVGSQGRKSTTTATCESVQSRNRRFRSFWRRVKISHRP
jgi:hypothetical protein